MKKITAIILLVLGLMLIASAAFAADADTAKISFWSTVELACVIAIGVAAAGTGVGMGLGVGRSAEGVARNPEAMGKIMTIMIVGLALIESLAIYTLVIIFILLYANPFKF